MSTYLNTRRHVKKTRFVLVSDTHSTYPKLPIGDILCHTGDLTNQGSITELRRTLDWINAADCERKIVIAGNTYTIESTQAAYKGMANGIKGNHDITLDKSFYSQQGHNFHSQSPQDPDECTALVKSYPNITYLCHSSVTVNLTSPSGPQTTCSIFGSPYVPARGNWAFGYSHDAKTAEELWSTIPLNTDVVLTHTPAYNHLDASPKWGAAGCEGLRKALWQVRPRLAVCGHVHEGRGVERVRWRLDLPMSPFLELETTQWIDPGAGNKKMSLVDLTRKGGNPLLNDGAMGVHTWENVVSFSGAKESEERLGFDDTISSSDSSDSETRKRTSPERRERHKDNAEYATWRAGRMSEGIKSLSRLHHRNTAALDCRHGRGETCIVNAAIMAKSYGSGPKRFNKPIVVDLELPIREEITLAGVY